MKDLPPHYRSTIRANLRFALVMVVVALLTGVVYQESAKKLGFEETPAGLHLEAVLHLALVHGHVFLTTVLIPIAMVGAMVLARGVGGGELGSRTTCWLTRGYLPFATVTVALMLYKGYHVLLAARGGETDLAIVYDSFFGGVTALRYAVYGLVHVGMGVSLGVFSVALWRSLSASKRSES